MTSTLSESLIREYSLPTSFRRGEEYQRRGAVISLTRRGEVLQAEVEGSEPAPYLVQIVFDESGPSGAVCSCPYDQGGWCKHVVATLLTLLHDPAAVVVVPPLAEALAALDREQLQSVILSLIAYDPYLAEVVDEEIAFAIRQTAATAAPPPPTPVPPAPSPVDTQPYRRQVLSAFHSLDRMRPSEAYWHVGSVIREVAQILQPAWSLITAGDGRAALPILEAITEEYVKHWTFLDDSNGELSAFFYDLGTVWTEALLSTDLTPTERESWVDVLADWSDQIEEYGVDYAFEAAILAVKQSWDYPPLLRVLQGEITESGAWDEFMPDDADELTVARLNVLERQGRYQEYLYLAEAEGQTERYCTMLVRLGKVEEAVEYGLRRLGTAEHALILANTLLERGNPDEAIRIAEHGLTLHGPRAALAIWLRDLTTSRGQVDRALPAAIIAFREQLDLSSYRAVQELAGEDWPDYRDNLLNALRQNVSYYPAGAVDIFLHERLFDDAINAIDGTWNYTLIERVAEAVTTTHPDWAIQASRQQAESIMDRGQADRYHHAVRWLTHARAAYRAAGQESDWMAYLNELIDRHHRKYKLRPMLEALRT